MDKLIALKTVIGRVYVDINRDSRKEIILPLAAMCTRPLIVFNEAYNSFITSVAETPDLFDRWLNIQIQVITELQDDQDAIPQFKELFVKILKETPGGQGAVHEEGMLDKSSYIIALAFRVYMDSIVVDGLPASPTMTSL